MNIGFIGLGKLGLPCATEIARAGYNVYGYDINTVRSDYINVVDSIKEVVKDKDIIFVAVPTPHNTRYDRKIPTADLTLRTFL